MKIPKNSVRRAVLVLALASAGLGVGSAIAVEPITRISEVRALSREEAAQARPVLLSGSVTWHRSAGQFIVQDESAGTWIGVSRARRDKIWAGDDTVIAAIRLGMRVEVEGVTDPGGYAPVILPRAVRVLDEKELPPSLRVSLSRFFSGSADGLRVEVAGIVQASQDVGSGWLLHLRTDLGLFTAEFPSGTLRAPDELVDAEVRVTGVAVSLFNTRGEITRPRIFASRAEDLAVDVPSTAAFAGALVPLDRIGGFRADPLGPHRVRVRGTVTFALPGKFFILQAGNSAVRVESQASEFAAGDAVEVSGFVDMSRHIGMLTEAQVRKVGAGTVPEPMEIGPEEIIALNTTATTTGQLAKPHDFDGHLVRFRGRLLAVQTAADLRQPLRQLTLAREGTILSAILHAGATDALDALRPGSELEITGLVQLEYTAVEGSRRTHMPSRLDVVLRNPADVVVVEAPSWWTPARLLAAVALVAAQLGAALVWVGLLRRQVRRKTQQLATEMSARRDTAIEFQATLRERNRLAANLHDTLLQTLGGIGFQMEACEFETTKNSPDNKISGHFPVARRMLDHALDELRGSVWALRTLPLHGLALPDALRSLARSVDAGHGARVEVRTTGSLSKVSDFVAGNLVLVVQEALHNALRHGRPRTITIEVRPDARTDWVALEVRDDGVGFAAGSQSGVAEGHFGLTGMRERIERLKGRLHITSAPGQGTTVQFEVPLLSYDEDLA